MTEPKEFGEEYDIHVNNGRLLEHFHEGNLTYRSKGISEKTPSVFLEVSPELAEERGLEDGTLVRLTSPYGNVKVKCVITDRVKGKQVYLPMNDSKDAAINLLTSSYADKDTDTPAYKETSAKMEILKKKALIRFRKSISVTETRSRRSVSGLIGNGRVKIMYSRETP